MTVEKRFLKQIIYQNQFLFVVIVINADMKSDLQLCSQRIIFLNNRMIFS